MVKSKRAACGRIVLVYGEGMTGLNFPAECGVMILPDCTMFPQGGLPLYIFEERYRRMLRAALEGDCLFAVGRSSRDEKGEICVSDVGTLGLIRASREKEDGTSELFMHGLLRVRFCEWLVDEEYPKARIEPLFSEPLMPEVDEAARRMMRGSVEDYLSDKPDDVKLVIGMLLEHCDEAGLMADLVTDRLVADANSRQSVLEAVDVGARVAKLCMILGSA